MTGNMPAWIKSIESGTVFSGNLPETPRRPPQDQTTKCTDPADKDSVIRDLRTKLNDKQGVIDSIRGDAEAAHGKIEGALEHRDSERLREARDAIENIIESIGVKP